MLYIIIVCTLLVAACLYFVLAPFFDKGRTAMQLIESEKGFDMKQVYEAVNELEMDALMNKISAEDFTSLKESYYRFAAESIQEKASVDNDIREALSLIRAETKTAETRRNE